MTVLQELYQIFWNPPAQYVHMLVHTIGWTAIVVAVYSYMLVVIHSSRAKRRQRRFLAGVAQVRKQPLDSLIDYGDDRLGTPRKR